MNSNIVDSIYKLRQSFLLIGLTGRTGSGCTTIAKLLQGSFEQLYAPNPCDYTAPHLNEKRKYTIVYNFLKTQWHSFDVISASDMLFFFVLIDGYDNFINAILSSEKEFTSEKDKFELGEKLQKRFKNASIKANKIKPTLITS